VSGERYINDEDYNCIINLPNDIQDHQVLKEGDILISLTGNVGRVSLCKDGDYLLNQRVGLLQLAKNVNQEFLYQILSSQRFENSDCLWSRCCPNEYWQRGCRKLCITIFLECQ